MTGIYDGRVFAWKNAWNAVIAAQRFRSQLAQQKDFNYANDLPEHYWALISESEAFTALAMAAPEVAMPAGTMIENEFEAELQAQSERTAHFFEAFGERKGDDPVVDESTAGSNLPDDVGPVCACDWSRQSCQIHPWPPKDDDVPPSQG